MTFVSYEWISGNARCTFEMAFVPGTDGCPYAFGDTNDRLAIEINGFHIGKLPVTQALWTHIMGNDSNTPIHQGPDLPVENVSWDQIVGNGGFLDRLNESPMKTAILTKTALRAGVFRLPSEAEWEYAARGGPHCTDGFRFSGSDDIETVAWYDRRHGDHTQPAGLKAPNQLGIYDMSGNVWEWCHDVFTRDITNIPLNGTPYFGPGEDRVLRGGCFHNGAIHCKVSKRYEITHDYRDGCIGFRLVLALVNP